MHVGTEVEYQIGIGEYRQGIVTATDCVTDTVTITGWGWPVPSRDVIELSALLAFGAWRTQWLEMAMDAMTPFGLDKQDVFFFASDNDGNLRSDFKAGKGAAISVKEHAGCVANMPRFDRTK